MLTIEQLYDIFLNKDNKELDQEGNPKNRAYAAMKAQAESYNGFRDNQELSLAEDALLRLVTQMDKNPKNITKKLFAATMTMPLKLFNQTYKDIPKNVLQNEGKELKETMDVVEGAFLAKENAYAEEMNAMIDNLSRLAGAVDKLRKGKDIEDNRRVSIDDNGNVSSEEYTLDKDELQTLYDANVDAMTQQMATMMAMDELKRTKGIDAAMDPVQVDTLAAELREKNEFGNMYDRMDQSAYLSRDDLAGIFYRAGYTGITEIFDQTAEKKAEQSVKKNEEQPVKKNEEQPVRDFAINSAKGVFIATMGGLQKSVAEAKGKILSDEDKKKVAGSLLDVIALRELAHKDSRKPLSAEEIQKQKEDILNRDNKQFSAYRAVLKKMEKSPTATVRIVEGLDDKTSLREFKENLVKNAGIQLKEKVDTKTVEKGAHSPEKK